MFERYHPTSDSISLIAPHSRGDYVRYSDYAALEAQLAEALRALEQAEQQLDYGQVNAAHRIIIRAIEAQGGE